MRHLCFTGDPERSFSSMNSLAESLTASLRDNTFLRLTLSQPMPAMKGATPKITVRPILLRDEIRYQSTSRVGSQEHHENLSGDELQNRVCKVFTVTFADAHLFTTAEDQT